MKNLLQMAVLFIIFTIFSLNIEAQIIYVENFEYATGDALTAHGWTQIRNGSPIMVASGSLSHSGYIPSGIGNSAALVDTGEQEISMVFQEQTTDSIYFAYLIQVNDVTTDGGLYFYAGGANTSVFTKRLTAFVKKDVSDYLYFGMANTGGINYFNSGNLVGSTNLIIMKYKFNPGPNDDTIDLWVNPVLDGIEPLPDESLAAGTDATGLSEIVLSQLSGSNYPPTAIMDGISISLNWQSVISSFKSESGIKTREFILNQNYPNPFNPKTTISYFLPVAGKVDMSVYNILGQNIATIISKKQSAGKYKVEVDATEFASGIYFYKLKTPQGTQIKKMQVIK
jgi:hypothetical protein